MKITVVGAGNMGLALASYIVSNNKADVALFTDKKIFEKGNLIFNVMEEKISVNVNGFLCTKDPLVSIGDADIIFITYPAFLRKNFIENYGRYIKTGAYLCFVPGYGGIEYSCDDLIDRGVNIVGFQRVPYVARANIKNGIYEVNILSKKQKLFIGCLPKSNTEKICANIEYVLDIPVQRLKEYLSITLAPSNPLLHITGLYNVFKSTTINTNFDKQLKFYEEWNDETSKLLFEYDAELQRVCSALDPLDLCEVVSLPVYYESPTPKDMTKKLKSIKSLKAVLVPLKLDGNKYKIDLTSRMFIEDYPYGVCVIKDIARMVGVDTPIIDMLLNFYEALSGHKYFNDDCSYTEEIMATGVPGVKNIVTKEDLINFYNK